MRDNAIAIVRRHLSHVIIIPAPIPTQPLEYTSFLHSGPLDQATFASIRLIVALISRVMLQEASQLEQLAVARFRFTAPNGYFAHFFGYVRSCTPEVAAGGGRMFLPRLQANPTEVVLAFRAAHVIATVQLLDVSFAARALIMRNVRFVKFIT